METFFVVIKNQYKDSIELLRLSAEIEKLEVVERAAAMMGTPSNLKLMQEAGYFKDAKETGATANDLIVGLVVPKGKKDESLEQAKKILTTETKSKSRGEKLSAKSISQALKQYEENGEKANIAIISVPGPYAAAETLKALKKGLHVFLFSDNVELEDEIYLKKYAASKNLLLMGPDCGTSVLDGVPFSFANRIRRGPIGLVGAAGTGLQSVSSLIDQYGEGISQMIGVGGHDLGEQVGGLMMLQGIERLNQDPNTKVIVLVAKAPSPSIATKVFDKIRQVNKPVVVCFLGDIGQVDTKAYISTTLSDAALYATQLAKGAKPSGSFRETWDSKNFDSKGVGHIEGLFSGGTFAREANLLLGHITKQGTKLSYTVTDLGDSQFTVGKPHPMIDPSTRKQWIVKAGKDKKVSVILLDVVLGYGSNEDPAGALVPAIKEAMQIAASENRKLTFVAHVCGTEMDPQNLHAQEKKLTDIGVLLCYTNAEAVYTAARVIGNSLKENPKEPKRVPASQAKEQPLMFGGLKGISLGLKGFVQPMLDNGANVIHLDWKPPGEGDRESGWVMAKLYSDEDGIGKIIDKANEIGVQKLIEAHPFLVDVQTAKDVLPNFGNVKRILHAGAPLPWSKMCGPMQGAIIGGILFEGWAKNENEAKELAASGEVLYDSCHHYSAVGPMSGIITPTMPVCIIKNEKGGNISFSNLNEGLGKALRFGAYDEGVLTKLKWMKESLGPALSKALKQTGKIDLKNITAQALSMGDEVHNRNIAATCLIARILAPYLPIDVLQFIQKNDHFYLNFSMACAKAILDSAHNIENSTIVTAMARNGVEFAIRVSGTGGEWFRQPAPVIEGLYFPGYSIQDANPDLGDSAITETCGLGGFSMAASPAIVKFVGGSASDSFSYTEEMHTICLTKNPIWGIPSMDFMGSPLGIDARKVVDQNSRPVVNTGIASKLAGVGQIGAGITRAPIACFSDSLNFLYKKNFQKRGYSTSSFDLKNFKISKKSLSMFKKGIKFF
eukprot:TRINITY_DN5866_c0_g1_i1.p1 TRINITY_DN5866_c0_g1~~TRINITY_DN5866_c0_g1_i1.p1  ORF type:complete len:1009 (-),score=374.96 TRINITY_DN5866_c0_g1_i1:14-3040(-)